MPVVSAVAWATAKAAIHAWVVAASGLAAGKVIWTFPGADGKAAPRPEPPYIALQISGTGGAGASDWRSTKDAADPEPGAELEVTVRGHRVSSLELQCFEREGTGGSAHDILVDVIAALPLYYYDLDIAGVGIGATTPVQLLEFGRTVKLEPRAVASVSLHLGSEVARSLTYVERMQVTTTARGPDGEVVATSEQWIPDPPLES